MHACSKICCYRDLLCSHGISQVRERDVPAAPFQLKASPEARTISSFWTPPFPSKPAAPADVWQLRRTHSSLCGTPQ